MSWQDLIGKRIEAFRGWKAKGRDAWPKRSVQLGYILFDDGETYLSFDTQDPYEYHDCSSSAREISTGQNKEKWQELMDKVETLHGQWVEPEEFP